MGDTTIFINERGELIEEVMSVVGQKTVITYYGVVEGLCEGMRDETWFFFGEDYQVIKAK